jgi:putative restriction endonuclease
MDMGYGVFIHRSDSIYDDSPAERYQFPSQYLGRVQSCIGDWIIYYEPRKVADTRGYFAVRKSSGSFPILRNLGCILLSSSRAVIWTS